MIAAVTVVLLVVIIFLMLYMSMLRSSSEHRTAIESAAIAAAKDISRIVVNTPEFGYVSLTTEPPIGTDTKAADNWYQEVRSINELMATSRLALIIADGMGDDFMKQLAVSDLNNVKKVKDDLVTEITSAIQPGGSAKDAAGNLITPYINAERVYLKNQAKGNSSYVPNSLVLTLGGVEGGIETSTPAPTPLSKGACTGKEANGRYLSETNIPFLGSDFVFGSVTRRVSLCDKDKFRVTVPGLPYQMPAVLKADATQQFSDQGKTWTVAYSACASAGSTEPPRPAPGALTISFPDGPSASFGRPGMCWSSPLIAAAKMDVYQVESGDFITDKPPSQLSPATGPFSQNSPAPAAEVVKLALYDWLRCGGSRVNIDSVLTLNSGMGFNPPSTPTTKWRAPDPANPGGIQVLGDIPTGVMHIYTFNPDGTIKYVSKDITPYPYTVVGEKQFYSELNDTTEIVTADPAESWKLTNIKYFTLNQGIKIGEIVGTNNFDLYVRDLSRNLGTISGGKHGGERLDDNPLVSQNVIKWGRRENVVAGEEHESPRLVAYASGETLAGPVGGLVIGVVNGLIGTANGSSTGNPGLGSPNPISRQDDFASSSVPAPTYNKYTQGPGGGGIRPAYTKNGVCADIRFRRQVKVGDLLFGLGGARVGYVGEMLPAP